MTEEIPISRKKPPEHDLVMLIFRDGRAKPGWWTGTGFDGLHIPRGSDIVAWSKLEGQRNNAVLNSSMDQRRKYQPKGFL